MPTPPNTNIRVAIIGGGPAGLMAAEVLCQAGLAVHLFDSMPSVGRKFLLAGKGGLNITHAEAFEQLLTRYGTSTPFLTPYLQTFTPNDLRTWLTTLGIDTFVGSSARVFPVGMKAAPLLRAWLARLKQQGLKVHTRHQWLGWHNDDIRQLRFQTPLGESIINAESTILALGGGSWPQLGSTGAWTEILQSQDIPVNALQPANCGFKCAWSDYLQQHFAGQALKSCRLQFTDLQQQTQERRGECIITTYGLEGGMIYALSADLRTAIEQQGEVAIWLDLLPDLTPGQISERLAAPRDKQSLSNYFRKRLHLDSVKIALLREILSASALTDPQQLGPALKALPLTLTATQPLAEAISSAGGVAWSAMSPQLMLTQLPGVFCAGEMLDWEAPTGGYLLTACLATGRAAGQGALQWLKIK